MEGELHMLCRKSWSSFSWW